MVALLAFFEDLFRPIDNLIALVGFLFVIGMALVLFYQFIRDHLMK